MITPMLLDDIRALNKRDRATVDNFAARADQSDHNGNFTNYLSSRNISTKGLNMLLKHAFISWSGFFLSGADCYRMDMKKLKMLREALKEVNADQFA